GGAHHPRGADPQHSRPLALQKGLTVAVATSEAPTLRTALREGPPVPDLAGLPAKIQVRNLNFYYGGYHALHDISLDIPEKQVTAFIGPSGCGKSTLLRTFNRMYALYPEQRAEGEVSLDGENVLAAKGDVALLRAKVGMVFQKPTPFPMSIYDNIAFGVRLF